MTSRLLSLILTIALASAASAQAPPAVKAGALKGWNVVLITLDATNPARTATYGGNPAVMPYFDSLAKKSLVMQRAYCTTGSTAPSHATMMTGLLPHQHRVYFNGVSLAPTIWWLPEELKKRGYATGGSSLAFFTGNGHGFERGFDTFRAPTADMPHITSNAAARKFFDEPLAALAARKSGPFFAWIHLKGGHAPLAPIAKKHLQPFAPGASTTKLPTKYDDELATPAERQRVEKQWLRYYDANLNEADAELRALMESFRKHGMAKSTLFVITADHGETFDHGILGEHWPSPWESTLRIPLVLYTESGAIPAGRVNDRLVTTTDITPTLLHLLGINDLPPGMEGKNLFGSDKRQTFTAASVSSILYESFEVQAIKLLGDKNAPRATVDKLRSDAADLERTGIFYWAWINRQPSGRVAKLIHFGSSKKKAIAGGPGAVQLYAVTADPSETKDLVSDERSLASAMLKEARTRFPLFGRIGAVEGLTSPNATALTEGLDAEAIARLKALGYLQ